MIPEIAQAILQYLDTPTLFSCLTVNKLLFVSASSFLYADPFHSTLSCKNRLNATRKLASWILRLSPSQDQDVVTLRRFLNVSSKRPANITIDYLDLVQKFALFNDTLEDMSSILDLENRPPFSAVKDAARVVTDAIDTIYWAASGHRLAQLRQIVVSANAVARYDTLLPQLANVEVVWLVFPGRLPCIPHVKRRILPALRNDYSPGPAFVYEHDLLPEIESAARFVESLVRTQKAITTTVATNTSVNEIYSARRQKQSLDVRLCNYPQWNNLLIIEESNDCTRPIFECLAPVKLVQLEWEDDPSAHHSLLPRLRDAPSSVDFSTVERILHPAHGPSAFMLPTSTRRTILQHSRSLTHLELQLEEDETSVFDWTDHPPSRQDEAQKPWDVAPLKRLNLIIEGIWGVGGNKPLKDALSLYGSTLEDISIDVVRQTVNLSSIRGLPRLRRLELDALVYEIDSLGFSDCPRLTNLILCEQELVLVQLNPSPLPLPTTLTHLTIEGVVISTLDWKILASISTLTELELSWWRYDIHPAHRVFSWAGADGLLFPSLKKLHLEATAISGLQFVIIEKGMPMLQSLYMEANSPATRFLFDTFLTNTPRHSNLTNTATTSLTAGASSDESDAGVVHPCHPLETLEVVHFDMSPRVLSSLLCLFPQVKRVEIEDCNGIEIKDVANTHKDHPTLEFISYHYEKRLYKWNKGDDDAGGENPLTPFSLLQQIIVGLGRMLFG